MKPEFIMLRPVSWFRQTCFDIAESAKFELFVFAMIGLNSFIMVFNCSDQAAWVNNLTMILNYMFMAFFIVETTLKLTAFGCRYFKNGWNQFDFIVIFTSIVALSAQIPTQKMEESGVFFNVTKLMRIFMLMRLIKLFQKLETLKIIYATIINTLPRMINVGMMIILVIFMYSVLGINLFGAVKNQPPMSLRHNFENFPNAFMTLFCICTGETFNELVYALAMKKSEYNDCIEDPTYADYVANNYKTVGCGSNLFVTLAFFITFTFLLTFVCLNLFIAIILAGYFDASQ